MLKLQSQSKEFSAEDSDSDDVPFNKHILIIAGKNSKIELSWTSRVSWPKVVPRQLLISRLVIARSGARVKFAAIDRLGENVTALAAVVN